jgi:hypothetical protein
MADRNRTTGQSDKSKHDSGAFAFQIARTAVEEAKRESERVLRAVQERRGGRR